MSQTPFVIERTYDAPIDKVWSAISNRDEMAKWYFDLAAFKPEIGFKFDFKGGPSPENQYLHLCEVTQVEEGKKLAYNWRYDGYEGNSEVIFELFDEGGKTRVKLTHKGLDTFPANNPDLAKENFAAGWTQIMGTLLPDFLAK